MSYIPVNEPLLDGNEKKYLHECIETGWISSEGPFIKKLEEGMANYVGRKYGIAVCNGTIALDLALEVLQLQADDEVIMPSFTIISCAAALVRRGIKPVLVDVCEDTWNMDVTQIESKITDKTKAIMAVHIYGLPVDMDSVIQVADQYGLKVIEDAAEAHGLSYKGKQCGSFGDISILSFYPNKHITTGEGGMVLCDDEEYMLKCKYYRNLCFQEKRRFVHEDLGYNYRMSNLQAAVGVAQLEKIKRHIEKKLKLGEIYTRLLKNIPEIQIPVTETPYATNIYWVFGVVLQRNISMNAMEVMQKLEKRGIGTRPFFYPMHQQPVFLRQGLFLGEVYPVSEYLAEKGFYLPSGLTVTEEQAVIVADRLKEILENK